MSTWVTVSEFRQYITATPGAETDAVLQAVLDRAEALIGRYLIGVLIEPPAPEDLKQIVLEKASDIHATKGTPSLQATVGIDGSGEFEQITYLTSGQRAALRQIRIDAGEVAI
jgi:hypothetical protein